MTTMNHTLASKALAVFAAENILGIVPRGTHDWNLFITPEELMSHTQKSIAPLNSFTELGTR